MLNMMFNRVMYMVVWELFGKEKEWCEWYNLVEVSVFDMGGKKIWKKKLRIRRENFWKEFEKEVMFIMGFVG